MSKQADVNIGTENPTGKEIEMSCFSSISQQRSAAKKPHSPELWDERAKGWNKELEENPACKARADQRLLATVAYLLQKNALDNDFRTIDIGCGFGSFTVEFAKHVKQALGIDYSTQMIKYGKKHAKKEGLSNALFEICDFRETDPEEKGWIQAFDLVFASITPAVSKAEEWKKMIDMSRAYVFNSTFVDSVTPLEDKIGEYILGHKVAPWRDGNSFYSMFNTIWQWGYFPEVCFFDEIITDRKEPSEKMASKVLERFVGTPSSDDIKKAYDYLLSLRDDDGLVDCYAKYRYGWIFFDVGYRCRRQ